MVDIVGRARVIVESYVDEAQAKAAGKKTGDAAAKGASEGGETGGKEFSGGFAGSLEKFGPTLAKTAGGAIAAAVVGGALENFQRDAAGHKLVASLGLDGKEAAELNKTASKIYRDNWGESFDAVQQGVAATKSSFKDLDGDELVKASEAAQIFADIFDVDVVQAAGTASVAVKQGLAKDAVEAFDLMTAAAQKVPIQFRDELQDAVTEYSSFFHSLGLDGQTAFGILADASEMGAIGIDKAGDAIKEFGIRATDTSTTTRDAFKQLGLDQEKLQTDLAKGGKSSAAAFQTILDGLDDIKDPLEQRQAALALFGTPLEDLSQSELPRFIDALANGKDALGDFDDATAHAGDTASEGLTPALDTFVRSMKEDFLGGLNDVVVKTQEDMDALSDAGTSGKEGWEGLGQFFSDQGDDINTTFDMIGRGAKDFKDDLHDGWETIKSDVRTEFDQIKHDIRTKVNGWVDTAQSSLRSLPGKMKRAGGNAIQGFIDGLSDVGGSIGRSAGRIAANFKKAINDALPDSLTFFGGKGGVPAITIALPQLATGARNFPGGWADVGERGPERVYLPPGADVYNDVETRAMGNGGNPQTFVFNGPTSFAAARREGDWANKYGTRFGSATAAAGL